MIQDTLDKEKLAAVVSEAIVKVHQSGKDVNRWVNAIAKATLEMKPTLLLLGCQRTSTWSFGHKKAGKHILLMAFVNVPLMNKVIPAITGQPQD